MAQDEVYPVTETQAGLTPIEIRASAAPGPEMAAAIGRFRRDFGDPAQAGYTIHPDETILPLGGDVAALSFHAI